MISQISTREQQVLQLVACEFTTKEIAQKPYVSAHTIDSHQKNLKLKLEVRNAVGMVRRGFETGILSLTA